MIKMNRVLTDSAPKAAAKQVNVEVDGPVIMPFQIFRENCYSKKNM
jgi:hypothetical protein